MMQTLPAQEEGDSRRAGPTSAKAVLAEPLWAIPDQSGWLGEVPKDWRKANCIPTTKMSKKKEGDKSLTSVPGKVM